MLITQLEMSCSCPGLSLFFYHISRVLKGSDKENNKSFIDYLLIWPIVIEQHKKSATKNSNKFIVWGKLMIVMLVVGRMVFLN
jgi:hypothetical protein